MTRSLSGRGFLSPRNYLVLGFPTPSITTPSASGTSCGLYGRIRTARGATRSAASCSAASNSESPATQRPYGVPAPARGTADRVRTLTPALLTEATATPAVPAVLARVVLPADSV